MDVIALEPTALRSRLSFATFPSVDDPIVRAWARSRQPVLQAARANSHLSARRPGSRPTSDEPVGAGQPVVFWRLLATNNRELGRSFMLYHSVESARSHVEQLRVDSTPLEIVVIAGPLNASHGWYIARDGAPVMSCSRWYGSTSTAAGAARRTLAAIADAELSSEPARSAVSGRFARVAR